MVLSNFSLSQAIDQIRESANEFNFQRRRKLHDSAVVGIAEGDSWFDFLPSWTEDKKKGDLINQLNRMEEKGERKFNILRVAEAGDTLENMIFGSEVDKDNRPIRNQFLRTLELVDRYKPAFLLFSGGGNDVVGDGLQAFVNHAEFQDSLGLLREEYVDYMIDQVFKQMFEHLITEVKKAQPDIHILLHGYGHAIPSGKAVIDTRKFDFIGPWMEPTFTRKRITFEDGQDIITALVDRFNAMLSNLVSQHANVHYLDLRNLIQDDDWGDELHLTVTGYEKVAQKYNEVLSSIFPNAT